MSFDTQFRKELRSMLSTTSQNHSTISEKEVKHVSWVSIENETDENKNKKQSRSTPHPKRKSSKDEINIKPTVLSFNDCFESIEEMDLHPRRKRKVSAGEYSDFKKKLTKKTVSSDLNVGWLETDVSSPLNHPESDISNENVIVSEIDPDGVIAKEILKKIKDSNVYNDLSTTDESLLQNESFTASEFDKIELFNGDCFDSGTSLNGFSHSDSSSSDEETFKVPKIVKNAKRFKQHCQIIDSESIFTNVNSNFNTNEHNLNGQYINEGFIKPKKERTIKNNNKSVGIQSAINPNVEVKNINNSITSDNYEEDKSESGSSDTEFLMDNEENLDNTKDFSFAPAFKLNESISESVQFYITKKYSVLFLTHPTKLYFCGKLSLTVLSGAIEILGYIFESETNVDVYSPKGQSYLYISTCEREKNENFDKILKKYNIQVNEDFNSSSVLLVRNLENSLISSLNNHCPKSLFPKVSTNYEERSLSLLEMKVQCYFEIEPSNWPVVEIEDEWNSLFNSLDFGKRISLMACGGKSVGKSTFLKYITNKLLQNFEKVVYIDLDPGQPEFTISGCISITIVDEPLLGPNYTHLRKSERCHFLGEVNISHCFTRYISSVKDLMYFYRTEIDPTIPCVINYMGFTKSLGFDLITSIISLVSPSILVQIESDNRKHNYPALLNAELVKRHLNKLPVEAERQNFNYELKVLRSVTSRTDRSSVLEPKVLRNLCTVAYFSQALTTGTESISAIKPYCANLSSLTIEHVSETAENLLPVINGNLVALCAESSNECLGFGIVRGIDTTSDKIYIITPETSTVMSKVKTLVMGCIPLPSSFYTTAGFHEGSNPYICRTVRRATTSVPKRVYKACQGLLLKK